MGITQVTVAVRNPARPTKIWEGLFLVDTGAMDCMVPAKHLRALGLKRRGTRTYELADGSEVTFNTTVAEFEFMGETVGALVIFGPDDAEPMLGVTALESAGIEIDPRTQRLKRMPTLRLKRSFVSLREGGTPQSRATTTTNIDQSALRSRSRPSSSSVRRSSLPR